MATVIDDQVAAQLNSDIAVGVRFSTLGHQHALERLRGFVDQDGRALGAAIANITLLASLPDQAVGTKLAWGTPIGPSEGLAAPNPATPKT